jgi:hypothetical protein
MYTTGAASVLGSGGANMLLGERQVRHPDVRASPVRHREVELRHEAPRRPSSGS